MTLESLAAQTLRRAVEEIDARPDSPAARSRTVAALELALMAPPAPPRSFARPLAAVAAAVLLVVGAALAWRASSVPPPIATVISSSGSVSTGHGFNAGDVLRARAGEGFTVEVRGGVRLAISGGAEAVLGHEGASVVVRAGLVAAEVAASENGFVLETTDTVVATRGASVSVTPGAGCDGSTRVEVTRGDVDVRAGAAVAALHAGDVWPQCAPKPVIDEPEDVPVPVPAPLPPPTGERRPPSALERQNALYAAAVARHDAGDVTGAMKKLDELLTAFPNGPMAEPALAQKLRWLTPHRRDAAREAAREYLKRFPMGPARADAETLVLEVP